MTNEAIEAAARAMCAASGKDPDKLTPAPRGAIGLVPLWTLWEPQARTCAPALMEEGARLALEAAAEVVDDREFQAFIRALDPAAIVKGAGHDRD